MYASSAICEKLETACEDLLESEGHMRLPSMGRFKYVCANVCCPKAARRMLRACSKANVFSPCRAHYEQCETKFRMACIGPSLTAQAERLPKAWSREETRFRHDNNDKLLSGLIFMSLAAILLFRFAIRVSILETVGWVAFIFLQARLPAQRSAKPVSISASRADLYLGTTLQSKANSYWMAAGVSKALPRQRFYV